jgi:hypothetical protein
MYENKKYPKARSTPTVVVLEIIFPINAIRKKDISIVYTSNLLLVELSKK